MKGTVNIALITTDVSFGNCVGIYHALSRKGEVSVYAYARDKKKMYKEIPSRVGYQYIDRDHTHYYIVSAAAFARVHEKYPWVLKDKEKVTVILTDSFYRKEYEHFNQLLEGYRLFIMSDLSKLCPLPHKIFYHPYEHQGEIVKNEELTICHTPFSFSKAEVKGSEFIWKAVMSFGVQFDVVLFRTWKETITQRSNSHIFIDQLIPRDDQAYTGGLGKSGVEGMAAGCLTITSGRCFNHNGEIPPPPVIVANSVKELKQVLTRFITKPKYLQSMATEQKEWVEKYLNYEFQANYLYD